MHPSGVCLVSFPQSTKKCDFSALLPLPLPPHPHFVPHLCFCFEINSYSVAQDDLEFTVSSCVEGQAQAKSCLYGSGHKTQGFVFAR